MDVEGHLGEGYWVGLSDFGREIWSFSGPFTTPQTLDLRADKFFSETGDVHVAFLLAPRTINTYLTVNSLTLNTVPRTGPNVVLDYGPVSGDAPLEVNFDASATTDLDGAIVSYEWDTDGDGAYDLDTGLEPQLSLSFSTPGIHVVSLRVTDDRGLTSVFTTPGHFTGPAEQPYPSITVSGWTIVPLGRRLYGRASLAVINGCPAIAAEYRRSDPYGGGSAASLQYVRSLTPYGTAEEAWPDPVTIEPFVAQTDDPCLVEINGRPAISYAFGGWLHYAAASTASGMNSGDWQTTWIPAAGQDYNWNGTSLCEVGGNPAICAGQGGQNGSAVVYLRAATPLGAAADWDSVVTIDEGQHTFIAPHSLKIVNGHPAIGFVAGRDGHSDITFARATSATGQSTADWQIISLDSRNPYWDYGFASLAVIGGTPAMVYGANADAAGRFDAKLTFAHAVTLDGADPADWIRVPLTGPVEQQFYYTDVAAVAGRPAVCADSTFYLSSDTDGMQVEDWQGRALLPSQTYGNLCLADVNGKLAVLIGNDTYAVLH